MNIKEACRYQNFLTRVISELNDYLIEGSNVVKIKERHLKSKVHKDAQDEEIDNTPVRRYDIPVNTIINFVNELINEKLRVSMAIEKAKRLIRINWVENNEQLTLDTAIEHNKNIYNYANVLKPLIKIKTTETKIQGTDYTFNAEGNQVTYVYPIERVKSVDFNKEQTRELYKKILVKADKISTEIDTAMLKDIVDYIPKYNIHDTVEDLLNELNS